MQLQLLPVTNLEAAFAAIPISGQRHRLTLAYVQATLLIEVRPYLKRWPVQRAVPVLSGEGEGDEGEQQERQEQANHGEVAAVLWCAGGAARIAPRGTVVLAHGHLHSRGFVVNREPIQQ